MIWGIEVGEEKKYEQYPLLENTAKNRELFLKEENEIAVRRLSGDKAVEAQDEMGLELR